MKSVIASLLTTIALLVAAGSTQAGPIGGIKATLASSRQQPMTMLSEDDHTVMEMRYEEALKSRKHLDSTPGGCVEERYAS